MNELTNFQPARKVAKELNVSYLTLWRLAKAGKIKFYRLGRKPFVNTNEILTLFTSQTKEGGK